MLTDQEFNTEKARILASQPHHRVDGAPPRDGFWDFFWFVAVTFLFVAYLMVLFQIITDLFRDHQMSGWLKALWLVFLFLIPFLSALIYLIVRNEGMTERSASAFHQVSRPRTATSAR